MPSADSPEPPIVDPSRIAGLIADARASGALAVDTESNSMFVHRERVCLVQLGFADRVVAIDPLAMPSDGSWTEPLRDLLEDPEFPVFLHGGEYDVAVLKREWSICVRGVYDTQQAASYLGWERTGYGSLVERVCGVKLGKKYARHDWGRRPLEDAPLAYALDDVRYLPRVVEAVRAEVLEADLEEEVDLANRAVEAAAPHRVVFDPAGFHRIKDARKLDADERLRLQVLFAWREERGRLADRPPGRLVNQQVLVLLARRPPRNSADLRKGPLSGAVVRRHGESLLQALAEAERVPPEPVPAPARRKRPPAERKRFDKLKAWRRSEAERRGVGLAVVLPAAALEALAIDPSQELADVPMLGSKRARMYGDVLREKLGRQNE